MKQVLGLFAVSLLVSCASSTPKKVALLDYSDFGPQIIASEVIGMDWWQWHSHGNSRPTKYNIKVVVYRDKDIGWVKDSYPVDKETEMDFRYLNCDQAQDYLLEKISEDVLEPTTNTLKATYEKLSNGLCGWDSQ